MRKARPPRRLVKRNRDRASCSSAGLYSDLARASSGMPGPVVAEIAALMM